MAGKPDAAFFMEFQEGCDRIFSEFARGRLSRPGYVAAIDQIYNNLPETLQHKVDYRRDRRTPGLFALYIYDNTRRERFLVEEWLKLVEGPGLSFEDHGIGNDGRFIIDARGSGRPDYLLRVDGADLKVEVKFGPSRRFCTFKLQDLENYAQRDDILLLTFLGDASMMGSNGDPEIDRPLAIPEGLTWFPLNQEGILWFLDIGEHGNHHGFGGKATVRVQGYDLSLREWEPVPSLDFLECGVLSA